MCAMCYPCNHVYMDVWCVPSATTVPRIHWGLVCTICYTCDYVLIEVWCVPSATLVTMCTLKFEFLGVRVSVTLYPPKHLCTQRVPLLCRHSSQNKYCKVSCPFCVCLRFVTGFIVLFH